MRPGGAIVLPSRHGHRRWTRRMGVRSRIRVSKQTWSELSEGGPSFLFIFTHAHVAGLGCGCTLIVGNSAIRKWKESAGEVRGPQRAIFRERRAPSRLSGREMWKNCRSLRDVRPEVNEEIPTWLASRSWTCWCLDRRNLLASRQWGECSHLCLTRQLGCL